MDDKHITIPLSALSGLKDRIFSGAHATLDAIENASIGKARKGVTKAGKEAVHRIGEAASVIIHGDDK